MPIAPSLHATPISPILRGQARELLAQAIEDDRRLGKNAADSVRAGRYGNAWTEAAIVAIERVLRDLGG